MSASVIFLDIQTTYFAALQRTHFALPPAPSYREYSARQHAYTRSLNEESPGIRSWRAFLAANNGALPRFPLELGESNADTPGAIEVFDLIDDEQGRRFEAACRAAGARFSGGVFACAALTEHRLTGAATYFGLTPFDNRRDPAHTTAVGWLASFVPLAIPTADASFDEVVSAAQASFDANAALGAVPYYHLLETTGPSTPIEVPDRPVPMLSDIDIRKLPFGDTSTACAPAYGAITGCRRRCACGSIACTIGLGWWSPTRAPTSPADPSGVMSRRCVPSSPGCATPDRAAMRDVVPVPAPEASL